MSPEASTRALRQMLAAWARCVHRHPHRSPVGEAPLMHLVARCNVLMLELAPFLKTTVERRAL